MSTQRGSTTAAGESDPISQPDVGRERLPGCTGLAIPALLLLASGTALLVYQVLWIKQLSLLVGVDVYAVTTGVSAFFAGLAFGDALFGRWADRLVRRFLLYTLLELGIAVLGVAATLALARAARSCWVERLLSSSGSGHRSRDRSVPLEAACMWPIPQERSGARF